MAKKYNIDIKWIVILIVVAFLVIFEVIPLSYLLIRSLFPKGSFSLESFKRVYTYDLNWTAYIRSYTCFSIGIFSGKDRYVR